MKAKGFKKSNQSKSRSGSDSGSSKSGKGGYSGNSGKSKRGQTSTRGNPRASSAGSGKSNPSGRTPNLGKGPTRSGHGSINMRQPGRWVIGIHSVNEAIKVRPKDIGEVWIKAEEPFERTLLELESIAKAKGIHIYRAPAKSFGVLGSGHQGVACRVLSSPVLNWEKLEGQEKSVVLVLDELEDPHNLGAVLRTAWLMGVDGILIPQNRSADLSPTVNKIACGGAEHVPVEIHSSLQRTLTILKEKGFWIFGLDMEGATDLWATSFPERVALIVGSEGRGIRSSLRGECDKIVSIFQCEQGPSYNASVATSLALGEIFRQRNLP